MKDIGGAIVLYSHELELSMEEIEKLLAAKIQNLHNSMREAAKEAKTRAQNGLVEV